jgi:hypothetical protein
MSKARRPAAPFPATRPRIVSGADFTVASRQPNRTVRTNGYRNHAKGAASAAAVAAERDGSDFGGRAGVGYGFRRACSGTYADSELACGPRVSRQRMIPNRAVLVRCRRRVQGARRMPSALRKQRVCEDPSVLGARRAASARIAARSSRRAHRLLHACRDRLRTRDPGAPASLELVRPNARPTREQGVGFVRHRRRVARTVSSLGEIAEQMNRPPLFDMHEALVGANRAPQRRTKILCMTGEPSTHSPDRAGYLAAAERSERGIEGQRYLVSISHRQSRRSSGLSSAAASCSVPASSRRPIVLSASSRASSPFETGTCRSRASLSA